MPQNNPKIDNSGQVIARNTALNLVGRLAPLFVAIVTVPYVIHHLGPNRFGLLSLAWTVVGYFALFNLGIGPATTKFVAELLGNGAVEQLPELVWTAVASQACLGLVAGILLVLAAPLLADRVLKIPVELHAQAHLIFLILAAALPVDFASGSLQGVLGASQRFDLLNAISVPSSALTYALPVAALALGFGLPMIVLALVLARTAALAVVFLLCLRLYPALWCVRFNPQLVRALLSYGGWVIVSDVVGPILVYFDRFLIGAIVSIAGVGFYTPPYTISSKLSILPASLVSTLFPAFSTSAGRGDAEWIRNALIRSLKFLLLLTGPVTLILVFFSRPLLTLWLGESFAVVGTSILQILTIGVFINGLTYVPINLLYGVGRPDLPAKFHLVELPLYIALAWLLITRFGLPGAALAWAIRVMLDFLLLIAAACWVTGTPARLLVSKDLGRSLGVLVALAVGLAALLVSIRVFIADVTLVVFLSGAFLLTAWHYVLDLEEKGQIRLWLKIVR